MKAQNRKEVFLKSLAEGSEVPVKPLTREEILLKKQAERENNIMFINLLYDVGLNCFACDMKEVDVWNAIMSGKMVYALDHSTMNIVKAEGAGDEVVRFDRYLITPNNDRLNVTYFVKDYNTHMPNDADGYSWKKTTKTYKLTPQT